MHKEIQLVHSSDVRDIHLKQIRHGKNFQAQADN